VKGPRTYRGMRLGLGLALTVFVLDQLSKFYILDILRLPEQGPIAFLPVLDLSFVWNHGISLGLFQQGSSIGRWALVSLELAAVVGIFVWIARTSSFVTTMGLGLIAGGALGNALDRAFFGAVRDFLHLHGGAVRWLDFPYVFNVADAGISLGVTLLVFESLFVKGEPKGEALEPGRDLR
jgi:signal peptidase II